MAIEWKPETFIALYAAALSSLLAAFQIWQHLHSGVRLKLSVMANGVLIGGSKGEDETDLVVLTVINRGTAPTQITNMVLLEKERSWWKPWRSETKRSFIIPNPQPKGYPSIIPFHLLPSKNWIGCFRRRDDIMSNVHLGRFYVGVHTTNRDRPYLIRVPAL